jgi:hypothetical protein
MGGESLALFLCTGYGFGPDRYGPATGGYLKERHAKEEKLKKCLLYEQACEQHQVFESSVLLSICFATTISEEALWADQAD